MDVEVDRVKIVCNVVRQTISQPVSPHCLNIVCCVLHTASLSLLNHDIPGFSIDGLNPKQLKVSYEFAVR
jgi:hypothetical protein